MNIKKGFTIIELALVLIAIGIILGITTKGMDLVVEAIGRKEVQKINKVETALATYFAKNLNNAFSLETLQNIGLITDGDITLEWPAVVNNRPRDKFLLTQVRYFDDITQTWYTNGTVGATGRAMQALSTDGNYFSARYSCFIERLRDDRSFQGGRGRGFNLYDQLPEVFDDCSVQDPTTFFDLTGFYSYVVFDPRFKSRKAP